MFYVFCTLCTHAGEQSGLRKPINNALSFVRLPCHLNLQYVHIFMLSYTEHYFDFKPNAFKAHDLIFFKVCLVELEHKESLSFPG